MATGKKAPNFAEKLNDLLSQKGKTQGQLVHETCISASSVNRICKDGAGSEDNICIILKLIGMKRRRMIEMLTDRRAELSTGEAHKVWANFRYAFVDEDEYLNEICPIPLPRAYACTHYGISLQDVVTLAKKHGITRIQDVKDINPWQFMSFVQEFGAQFSDEAKKAVLSKTCEEYPPVLLLEFFKEANANQYLNLKNCEGKLLFGLPHLVLGEYTFGEKGEICAHRNTGGVEFLYSLKGVFELTYQGQSYVKRLEPNGSIFLFDARLKHSIKLAQGKEGLLLMVRFDPKKTKVDPGKPRSRKRKKS